MVSARQTGKKHSGFSLFELNIVLVITSVLAAGGLTMMAAYTEKTQLEASISRLDAIEKALLDYRRAYNRLPCPSDVSLAENSANFGVEAANIGTCTGGTPAANFGPSNEVVAGGVPVKALRLPDEYATDGWGRRFEYAVWQDATAANGVGSMASSDGTCGKIVVKDDNGGDRTQYGLYLLLSTGEDGHGGFMRTGTRMSKAVTNADTLNNCNCTAGGVADTYDHTYVQRAYRAVSSVDRFDDLVRFKLRSQMLAWDENLMNSDLCVPGIRVDGATASDRLGVAVASGDVNGDGIADLIMGGYGFNGIRGAVYVYFGKVTGWSTPIDLNVASNYDGTNGVRFDGALDHGYLGYAVGAGDINGDGRDDILMGAYGMGNNGRAGSGSVYVFFGRAVGNWAATYDLSVAANYNGTNGVRFDGAVAADALGGWGPIATGDVNGDNRDDIIMSATGADNNGRNSSGSAYVYFGRAVGDWAGSPYDMNTAANYNGVNGVRFDGAVASDMLSYAVAAGDVNGDGKEDIIMSAPSNGVSWAGKVYVFFGRAAGAWSATYDAADPAVFDGTKGVRFDGEYVAGDHGYLGSSLAAGDVNGDGKADIVMGADGGASGIGRIYVFFGRAAGAWSATYALASCDTAGQECDGTNGVRFDGANWDDIMGSGVGAGDVNGDGLADILMGGNEGNTGYNADGGLMYVYFGKTSGWSATPYALSSSANWNGTTGIRFNGENQGVGYPPAVGDLNGDNRKDIIIGTQSADFNSRANSGSTYVYWGRLPGTWPTSPLNLSDW